MFLYTKKDWHHDLIIHYLVETNILDTTRSTVARKGHGIGFRDQIFRLEILSLETRTFELEVLSLQTRSFDFRNSKFCVHNLEISSLETRNFAFTNSKFRVWKLVSVKRRLHTRGKMQINVII